MRFDLFVYPGPDLEHQVAEGSITEPGTSPSALTVGAVCWQGSNLETYSSEGPTIDGRVKPDLVGPDSVSSFTYGPFAGCGSSGFAGTSAATPHVAAAAALVKEANPAFGPAELQAYLEDNAVDLGATGRDSAFGSGQLLLGAAPRLALRACVVPAVIGRRLPFARDRIRRAGCRVGTVRRARLRGRAGRVAVQRPRPGTRLAPLGRVNLDRPPQPLARASQSYDRCPIAGRTTALAPSSGNETTPTRRSSGMHRTTLHKRVLGALAVVGVAATMAGRPTPLRLSDHHRQAKAVVAQATDVRDSARPGRPAGQAAADRDIEQAPPVPPSMPPAAKPPITTSSKPAPLPPAADPVSKPLPVPTATGLSLTLAFTGEPLVPRGPPPCNRIGRRRRRGPVTVAALPRSSEPPAGQSPAPAVIRCGLTRTVRASWGCNLSSAQAPRPGNWPGTRRSRVLWPRAQPACDR